MQKELFKKGLVFIVITFFTLTSIVPSIVGQGEEYFYANQDIPVQNGGTSGDYTDTFSSDDVYEAISERESGGKPSNRYSYLEHKWTFELTNTYTSIDFYIEAYHTTNSEGDDFVFAYSTNDIDYTDIVTVTKASDDDSTQGVSLPSSLTGTIYIRVKDTDQTKGNRIKDTIYIDYMYILAMTAPDTTPPVISNVASSYDFNNGVEILTYSSSSGEINIWENQFGGWSNTDNLMTTGALRIRVGNVDEDPENEIVAASSYVKVWDYQDGSFVNTWNSSDTTNIRDVDIGDVDNDGSNEIVTALGQDTHSRIYKFNGTSYERMWISPWTETLYDFSVRIGDITNDNKIDFVYNDWNTILVYENQSGDFVNTYNITGAGNNDNIDIGDADNDNENELIFCGMDNKVHVVQWNGSGFDEVWDSGDMGAAVQDCAIGDVDGDNENEIVGGGGEMYVWEHQGGTTWNLAWNSTGYGSNDMKNINILDVDGDDKNEFTSGDGVVPGSWHIWGHVSGNTYTEEFADESYGGNVVIGAGDVDDDAGIQATITWDTDEPADSVVNYGITTALGNTESDSSLVTNHQIYLNGLLSDTTYYYEVQSTDASENTATDDNNGDYYSFTTILGPEISEVDSSVSDDTWIKMNPIEVDGSVRSRERFAMVYDSTNDRTIAFGGWHWFDGGQVLQLNDTWAYSYSDNTWTNRTPIISGGTLDTRMDFDMAYDSTNDRTVLYGGDVDTSGKDLNDTWVYDYGDNTWYNMSPGYVGGTLSGRLGHCMTYDSDAQRVILYGGGNLTTGILNDTWTYSVSDNTWYNMSPSDSGGSRPKSYLSELVYDAANKLTVLSCGGIGTGYINETWVYNFSSNTWVKRNPSYVGGTLTPRQWHSMAYDSNSEHVVLFGGTDIGGDLNDTWVYKTSVDTWYKVDFKQVGDNLYPREAPEIVYDSSADKIVLFSGWSDQAGYTTVKDTWAFTVNDPIATITWTTDIPSDSIVNYGTTTVLGNTTTDSSFVTNHKITLIDLLPGITYYYEIQSTDQYGYTTIDNNNGNYYTFITDQDTTPPLITNVQSSGITNNSVTISWDTDEISNSRVNYGTTTNLGDTVSDSSMVTSHSITLTDLLSETTYFYEVQSTDSEGNTETDDNNGNYYSFTTEVAPSNEMHVDGIDMWYTQTKNKYTIYSKIKIVDAENNAVEGVIVDIDLILPNAVVVSMSDITDSTGEVTFIYGPTPKSGTYTTIVTDVVKSGWIYNSDDNVETTDSLIVT